MANQVTLYKKKVKTITENVKLCKDCMSSIGVLSLNIPITLKTELEDFLNKETNLIDFLCNSHSHIEEYLNEKFYSLLKWLKDWIYLETNNPGCNESYVKQLGNILYCAKIATISVILYRNNQQLTQDIQANLDIIINSFRSSRNELENFAQNIFASNQNAKFEDIVIYAKR